MEIVANAGGASDEDECLLSAIIRGVAEGQGEI